MKRKLALFLTVTLSISLLVGCGGGSQEETPSGYSQEKSSSGDNSSVAETTNNTVKKSNTFSGYLSNEDTILFEVREMDKDTTPREVYFFRDGKVTIIPGEIVGLTLGELSNMSDDDIWASYDTYKTKYDEQQYTYYENNVLKKYKQGLEAINLLLKILEGNTENISPEDTALVREMWGVDSLDALSKEELIMHSLKTLSMGGDGSSLILEESCVEFVNMYGCEPVEYFAVNGEQFIMGEATGGLIKDALAQYRPMVELAMNSCKYVSPFYEMPFTCVIETDATGNVVKTEEIVVPYWWESLVEVSQFNSSTYSSSVIELTNQAEGGEIKIYYTTYNCYPCTNSRGGLICTRASMRIDGVDSEGVLIDPSSEQIKDLYKDITLSRFE